MLQNLNQKQNKPQMNSILQKIKTNQRSLNQEEAMQIIYNSLPQKLSQ
jgi:hypothetical protein